MISITCGWPATETRRLRGHRRVAFDVGGALGGAENAVIRAAISEHAVSLFSIAVEAVGVPCGQARGRLRASWRQSRVSGSGNSRCRITKEWRCPLSKTVRHFVPDKTPGSRGHEL